MLRDGRSARCHSFGRPIRVAFQLELDELDRVVVVGSDLSDGLGQQVIV